MNEYARLNSPEWCVGLAYECLFGPQSSCLQAAAGKVSLVSGGDLNGPLRCCLKRRPEDFCATENCNGNDNDDDDYDEKCMQRQRLKF